MSLLSLSTLCEQIRSDIKDVPVLEFTAAQKVARVAKELSCLPSDDADGVVAELEKLHTACAHLPTKAVILNNVACVEKRRGNLTQSLSFLEAAVKAEGGMAKAFPTTLVNYSAAFCGVQRYSEAAAVAKKAIAQVKLMSHGAVAAGQKRTLAAAHYNLGAALEGSGELHFAEEAYREVMALFPEGEVDPYAKAAQTAVNNLLLARQDEHAAQWATQVAPGLAHQARGGTLRKKLPRPNNATLPQLLIADTPHRSQSALAHQSNVSPGEVGHRAASVMEDSSSRARRDRQLRADIADVYTGPIRKFHSLPPLLSPVPYEDRRSGEAFIVVGGQASRSLVLVEPQNTMMSIGGGGGYINKEQPQWNPDPVLQSHELSYRIRSAADQDWSLVRDVEQRFIPRALVPLVEDIRYKEGTRRAVIIGEWKRRLDVIRRARDLAAFAGEEDSLRVTLEIEETRVRRVLRQWVIGKLLFADRTAKLDKEELLGREKIMREAQAASSALYWKSTVIHPQAIEEMLRTTLEREEMSDRVDLQVSEEAGIVLLDSRAAVRQNVKGTAYALALWCLESVIPEGEIVHIEDKAKKNSIAVLERFALFGKPKRAKDPTTATPKAVSL